MSKAPVVFLCSMLALGLAACRPKDVSSERNAWISAMLDVQREISSQLLKLETDRDAMKLSVAPVDCSPQGSRAAYDEISARLRSLSIEGTRIGLPEGHRDNIDRVLTVWSALERRHESLWEETAARTDLPAIERCMRPSELTLTRLRLEEGMTAAIKVALQPTG